MGPSKTAANVDPGWTDYPAEEALRRWLKRHVTVVNDADAAGVAEMRFGAGRGEPGSVFLITLGTGTGSALFWNGTLVPNLELGHMEIRGRDAEKRSAAAARVRRGLSWKAWAADLDEHLLAIEKLFWPNLFIIGGGVSKRADKFMPRLTTRARIVPAQLLNDAGIVGSAVLASEREAEAAAGDGSRGAEVPGPRRRRRRARPATGPPAVESRRKRPPPGRTRRSQAPPRRARVRVPQPRADIPLVTRRRRSAKMGTCPST